ncbi:crocetin glucosyltransferase chloroplastic [Prunus yedoensis var. nudiflora]|uniref:Crocetin glucosyltransferase chloroplastic n=1 Tax=Prunus yedoensis var. nudiflora TaxID=2094558 RepID=A0A314ZM04_PRUYE|nr:crocetin glucosyltransferase chloroplastic [Prunus yedoensis var. nudiflora]
MVQHRFLFLTYPAQGHINPALQLAKRLIRTTGANVTYVISLYAYRRIVNGSTPNGLTYAPYSDGYDDGFKFSDDVDHYTSELRRAGSQVITDLVAASAKEGHPYTCLVYTILLPWAADLARELHLPSVLAWIQAATLFDVYYYYLSGYKDLIRESFCTDTNDPSCSIQLPGLPLDLASRDLPSFMLAANPYNFALPLFEKQFELLERETKPIILVNTFDALEPEALKAIDKYNLIGNWTIDSICFLGRQGILLTRRSAVIFSKNQWTLRASSG